MKKIALFLFYFYLFTFRTLSQDGWVVVYSNVDYHFTDVYFSSSNIGNVVGWYNNWTNGFGLKLRTTDGGLNWTSTLGGVPLKSIHFADSIYGGCVGYYHGYQGNPFSKLCRSTNGGYGWYEQVFPSSPWVGLEDIYFVDKDYGYAVGQPEKILHTINGGLSWHEQTPGLWEKWPTGITFFDYLNGFIVDQYGHLYKTTNGGINWIQKNLYAGTRLNKVVFVDSSNIIIVGNGGKILKSIDKGETWESKPSGTSVNLNDCSFVNDNTGYIVGASGTILYTLNKGDAWLSQYSGTTLNFNSVHFTDLKNGWVVGDGVILHTTNGGITFIGDENYIDHPKNFLLSQNYPNPFNPGTNISYQLPVAGIVTLKVYDVLGNEVATLVDGYRNTGSYEVEFNANHLPSGVYFYQLKAGDYLETKKMILLK